MEYGGLGLLEKLIIYKHCRHDVRYNLFCSWEADTDQLAAGSVDPKTDGSPSSNADGREEQSPGPDRNAPRMEKQPPKSDPSTPFNVPEKQQPTGSLEYAPSKQVVSPFISFELNRLKAQAKRIYGRKRYVLRHIPGEGVWRILRVNCKRFPDAMDLVDRSIDQIKSDIEQLEKVYQNTSLRLTQKRSEKLNQQKLPQAQMYQNAMEDEQERFIAELVSLYKEKCKFLIEKLRLIELMNGSIDQVKERYFLRIRYYYSKACEYNARCRSKGSTFLIPLPWFKPKISIVPLPFHEFTDEELSKMCGGAFDGDYTRALQETQTMLDSAKELLSTLPPAQVDGGGVDSNSKDGSEEVDHEERREKVDSEDGKGEVEGEDGKE